jgi:hypothetical protein
MGSLWALRLGSELIYLVRFGRSLELDDELIGPH